MKIAIIAALLSLSSVAGALPADAMYSTLFDREVTLEQDEIQYTYCHWLAETQRTDAIRRGASDHDVQLDYEDAFDYCYSMAPAEFSAASGVAQ